LARTVVRHIATPSHFFDGNPASRKRDLIFKQVRAVRAAPQRDHWRMFEQEQSVGAADAHVSHRSFL
jgi:hypothetical protein